MAVRTNGQWKGSITVEGAIILPIFIIIVFSMMMLTKLVYIHSIVQNAMVQTVKEISTYSYILKEVFRLNEIHASIESVLTDNVEKTKIDKKLDDFGQVLDGNVDMIFDIGDEVSKNPSAYSRELVGGGLSSAALNIYRDLLGNGTGLIAKSIFPTYVGKSEQELDELLVFLGVQGGIDGIRMKGELRDRGNGTTLELIAAYQVNLDPPLAYFLNGKIMVHRVCAIPWMGKDK